MRLSDGGQASILQLVPERQRADSLSLGLLARDIASGIEDLEQREKDLLEQQARLEADLKLANEKAVRLEQALSQALDRMAHLEEAARTNAELTKNALTKVAQSIGRVEETLDPTKRAATYEGGQRYAEAARRVLDLQKEVLSLLERARQEMTRRDQATDLQAVELLREARGTLQCVAEDVIGFLPDFGAMPLVKR